MALPMLWRMGLAEILIGEEKRGKAHLAEHVALASNTEYQRATSQAAEAMKFGIGVHDQSLTSIGESVQHARGDIYLIS